MNIIQTSDNYAIQKALTVVDGITLSRLHEFYVLNGKLASEYKKDAVKFIKATLKINWGGETKKALTSLLLELGFKKSYVSKLIEGARFCLELERDKSEATDWVESLPITSAYVLACCSREAFTKIWATDAEWGQVPLTQNQLTVLKDKYDKPKSFFKKLPPSALEKGLKLLSDYPAVVAAIQNELNKLDKNVGETTSS